MRVMLPDREGRGEEPAPSSARSVADSSAAAAAQATPPLPEEATERRSVTASAQPVSDESSEAQRRQQAPDMDARTRSQEEKLTPAVGQSEARDVRDRDERARRMDVAGASKTPSTPST